MLLHHLSLTDFKNIASASIEFSPKINCLVGNNGMGKSNLLDAIYLLAYCKSFSGAGDGDLIRRGAPMAMLQAEYRRRGMGEDLTAVLRPGRRKSLKRAGKEYRRLTDHIGAFPAVLVSPADASLIAGEREERRRFIDQIASQNSPAYLEALLRYNHCLAQRNSLLKADTTPDTAVLEVLEMQMDAAGSVLSRGRADTVAQLAPLFTQAYRAIGGEAEIPGLEYVPAVAEGTLSQAWEARRDRDRILGYTSTGPHRDDLAFLIDGAPARRFASQGQTKTFTTALRFAQYHLLSASLGMRPLLLLDDIFDKLDATRVQNIISTVSDTRFGQIFITDTNRAHLDETIAAIGGADSRLWDVSHGAFTPISTR